MRTHASALKERGDRKSAISQCKYKDRKLKNKKSFRVFEFYAHLLSKMTKIELSPFMEMQIYKIAFYPHDTIVHIIKPKVSVLHRSAHIDQNIALASIILHY